MFFVKSNDSFSGESLKIIFNEMYLFIPANTEKNHSEKVGGSNISNIF